MLALRFDRIGDLSSLVVADVPRPQCGADEILVEVKAAGLNPSDAKNVLGYFPYTTVPRVPGRDFAGIVAEGPAELLGREIWGTGKGLGFFRDGAHAEYIVLPAAAFAPKPNRLSFAQASACGVPYITAYDALTRCDVGSETKLVVIGANGAVGRAAINLAAARGARVLAAVRQPAAAEELHLDGFDTLLLGAQQDFAEQVATHFAPGAEVIIDTTGHWLAPSVEALGPFGRIAVMSAPSRKISIEVPILNLYRRGGSIVGVNSLLYDPIASARMLEVIGAAFDSGVLKPPPAPLEVPLHEGPVAYSAVAAGNSEKIAFILDAS
jgi:NADPH:quinone reductase-like Zn-dependent oxidoreductase